MIFAANENRIYQLTSTSLEIYLNDYSESLNYLPALQSPSSIACPPLENSNQVPLAKEWDIGENTFQDFPLITIQNQQQDQQLVVVQNDRLVGNEFITKSLSLRDPWSGKIIYHLDFAPMGRAKGPMVFFPPAPRPSTLLATCNDQQLVAFELATGKIVQQKNLLPNKKNSLVLIHQSADQIFWIYDQQQNGSLSIIKEAWDSGTLQLWQTEKEKIYGGPDIFQEKFLVIFHGRPFRWQEETILTATTLDLNNLGLMGEQSWSVVKFPQAPTLAQTPGGLAYLIPTENQQWRLSAPPYWQDLTLPNNFPRQSESPHIIDWGKESFWVRETPHSFQLLDLLHQNVSHQLSYPYQVIVEASPIETFSFEQGLFVMPLPHQIGPRDLFEMASGQLIKVDLDYFNEKIIHIFRWHDAIYLMACNHANAKMRIFGPVTLPTLGYPKSKKRIWQNTYESDDKNPWGNNPNIW